jgi:serine protease Do
MSRHWLLTIIASFTAGILLMGGFWLGVENSAYFNEQKNFSAASTPRSIPKQDVVPTLLQTTSDHAISAIVESSGPAVVKIETTSREVTNSPRDQFFRQFFGNQLPIPGGSESRRGLGSGFVINKDGYILTNYHVIEGVDSIDVFLVDSEEPTQAQVVGADPELDLAVLKIPADPNLPVLNMGDSDQIQVGDWSIAIGNPYGLDHTVTVGVISAKQRPLNIGHARFKNLLQTDASINPGNSGGPLLNLQGEVIGINTAINAQAQGIGFAIPINTVKEVLTELMTEGKVVRPWLGISVQDVTPEIANYFKINVEDGVIVGYVAAGSPAEKGGIIQGDVIVELNREKIQNSTQLVERIAQEKVGETVDLLVIRGGEFKKLSVTIGEKKYN